MILVSLLVACFGEPEEVKTDVKPPEAVMEVVAPPPTPAPLPPDEARILAEPATWIDPGPVPVSAELSAAARQTFGASVVSTSACLTATGRAVALRGRGVIRGAFTAAGREESVEVAEVFRCDAGDAVPAGGVMKLSGAAKAQKVSFTRAAGAVDLDADGLLELLVTSTGSGQGVTETDAEIVSLRGGELAVRLDLGTVAIDVSGFNPNKPGDVGRLVQVGDTLELRWQSCRMNEAATAWTNCGPGRKDDRRWPVPALASPP